MSLPNWEDTDQWDTLYLGSVLIPGVSRVDVQLPSGLDVQKPAKGKGATISNDGPPPATLTITVQLATTEVLREFAKVTRLLRSKNGGTTADPLEIVHPNALLWDIHVVTIGDISSPQPSSGQAMTITINAVEWAPAPVDAAKAKKKPKGNGGSDAPDAGWNDVDALIDDLKPSASAAP